MTDKESHNPFSLFLSLCDVMLKDKANTLAPIKEVLVATACKCLDEIAQAPTKTGEKEPTPSMIVQAALDSGSVPLLQYMSALAEKDTLLPSSNTSQLSLLRFAPADRMAAFDAWYIMSPHKKRDMFCFVFFMDCLQDRDMQTAKALLAWSQKKRPQSPGSLNWQERIQKTRMLNKEQRGVFLDGLVSFYTVEDDINNVLSRAVQHDDPFLAVLFLKHHPTALSHFLSEAEKKQSRYATVAAGGRPAFSYTMKNLIVHLSTAHGVMRLRSSQALLERLMAAEYGSMKSILADLFGWEHETAFKKAKKRQKRPENPVPSTQEHALSVAHGQRRVKARRKANTTPTA